MRYRQEPKDIRTREDVVFHLDGFGGGRPAVNVKVYEAFESPFSEDLRRRVASDNAEPEHGDAFVRFCEDRVSDEEWTNLFYLAAEWAWDTFSDDVTGESGAFEGGIFGYPVKVYSEGRSGGWAVVEGLPPVEEWDAVMLAKWRRFVKLANLGVESIPYDMLSILYLNRFTSEVLNPDAAADHPTGVCVTCGGPAYREEEAS